MREGVEALVDRREAADAWRGRLRQCHITFKALPPDASELAPAKLQQTYIRAPPPATPTDSLYDGLLNLDRLRRRGIPTDEEFESVKKKVLARSK
jgi:hypothetical protein